MLVVDVDEGGGGGGVVRGASCSSYSGLGKVPVAILLYWLRIVLRYQGRSGKQLSA